MIFPQASAVVVGLVERRDLNGKRVTVLKPAPGGRLLVAVGDGGKTIRVKPANLELKNMLRFAEANPRGTPWDQVHTCFGSDPQSPLSMLEVVKRMYGDRDDVMLGSVWKQGVCCAVLDDLLVHLGQILEGSTTQDDYAPLPSGLHVRVAPSGSPASHGVLESGRRVRLTNGDVLEGVSGHTRQYHRGGQVVYIHNEQQSDPNSMRPMFLGWTGFEEERNRLVLEKSMRYVVDSPTRRRLQCNGVCLVLEFVNHLFYRDAHTHVVTKTGRKVHGVRVLETSAGGRLVELEDGEVLDAADLDPCVPMQPLHVLSCCLTNTGYYNAWPDLIYTQIVRVTPLQAFRAVMTPWQETGQQTEGKVSPPSCSICMNAAVSRVLRPCDHAGTCVTCAQLLRVQKKTCPFCREEVEYPAECLPEAGWWPGSTDPETGLLIVKCEDKCIFLSDGTKRESDIFLVQ